MAAEESTNETLRSGGAGTDDHGTIEGAGKDRVYITKEGDTLDDVAAFFFGDPTHKQRLVDDNPELTADTVLTPGMRLRVGEDAERGDTVS